MTRPGFRRSSAGGGTPGGRRGGGGGQPPAVGAPFTQAQILHLMKAEFSRARRHGYPLSCLRIQVDRLPGPTDPASAELREVARRELGRLVNEKTRDHDHLGVVEDEGYLVVLPHTALHPARKVAERIREAFARLELRSGDLATHATLSLGIAACEEQETLFFDTLLSQAELALEWAIEAGGDRAEVFRRDRFLAPEDELPG